jgi:hypothetical protein
MTQQNSSRKCAPRESRFSTDNLRLAAYLLCGGASFINLMIDQAGAVHFSLADTPDLRNRVRKYEAGTHPCRKLIRDIGDRIEDLLWIVTNGACYD